MNSKLLTKYLIDKFKISKEEAQQRAMEIKQLTSKGLEKLHDMSLHEAMWISELQCNIIRVPKGWIYNLPNNGVFVPEHF